MNRTTLSFPEDLDRALRREARRRHSTVSAVAREVLSDHFGLSETGKRRIAFAGLVHDTRPGSTAAEMQDSVAGMIADSAIQPRATGSS